MLLIDRARRTTKKQYCRKYLAMAPTAPRWLFRYIVSDRAPLAVFDPLLRLLALLVNWFGTSMRWMHYWEAKKLCGCALVFSLYYGISPEDSHCTELLCNNVWLGTRLYWRKLKSLNDMLLIAKHVTTVCFLTFQTWSDHFLRRYHLELHIRSNEIAAVKQRPGLLSTQLWNGIELHQRSI